jgi:uncharacterized membrane protein
VSNKIKGIEFLLLAVGALAGAFLSYKMVSSPVVVATLPLNILAVNVAGSFVLGVFSILSLIRSILIIITLGLMAFRHSGRISFLSLVPDKDARTRQNGRERINTLSELPLSRKYMPETSCRMELVIKY